MPKSQSSPSILTLEDLAFLLDDDSRLPSGGGERFHEFVRMDPRLVADSAFFVCSDSHLYRLEEC